MFKPISCLKLILRKFMLLIVCLFWEKRSQMWAIHISWLSFTLFTFSTLHLRVLTAEEPSQFYLFLCPLPLVPPLALPLDSRSNYKSLFILQFVIAILWYSDDVMLLYFNANTWELVPNKPTRAQIRWSRRWSSNFCVCYRWERYGTAAANLINICHYIVMQWNRN